MGGIPFNALNNFKAKLKAVFKKKNKKAKAGEEPTTETATAADAAAPAEGAGATTAATAPQVTTELGPGHEQPNDHAEESLDTTDGHPAADVAVPAATTGAAGVPTGQVEPAAPVAATAAPAS